MAPDFDALPSMRSSIIADYSDGKVSNKFESRQKFNFGENPDESSERSFAEASYKMKIPGKNVEEVKK